MGSSFVILLVLLALIGTSQIGQAGAVSATFPASPKKTKEGGNRPEVNLVAGKGNVVGGLQPVPKGQGGATAYIGQCIQGARFFVDKFCTTVVNAKQHLIAGAAARGLSIFAMYPLDTIKTRLQAEASQVVRPAAGAGLLAQAGALYRGCPASLFGQIPYGMLTFGSYEVYKELISTSFPNVSRTFTYFISAILGDITGSFWLVPSEIVKLRLQSGGGGGLGLAGTIGDILATSGPGGFYKGYTGQIARDVPFRAIQLTTYETLKTLYSRLRNARRVAAGLDPLEGAEAGKLSGLEGAVLGAVAGSFSAGVTTPLDVIKTRMMMGGGAAGRSVLDVTRALVEKEGPMAVWKGLVPRVTYVGPSVAIFFMTYEVVKNIVVDGQIRLAQEKEAAAAGTAQQLPAKGSAKLVSMKKKV